MSAIQLTNETDSCCDGCAGSSPSRTPGVGCGGCDLVQTGDDDLARARVDRRAGQDEHALRLVRGEAVHARAQRIDTLARLGRTFHAGNAERQDRRHGGYAVRDAETGVHAVSSMFARVVVGQLHLPDPDPVEARGGVCRARPPRRRR